MLILLADKAYDSESFVNQALAQDMIPIIPPRKNRKTPRDNGIAFYWHRHLIENAFFASQPLAGYRHKRYAKDMVSFLVSVHILGVLFYELLTCDNTI